MKPPVPVWDASGEEPEIQIDVIEPMTPAEIDVLQHAIETGVMLIPVEEISREEFARRYPDKIE